MSDQFCVGSTVRLARPELPRSTGTATIATIQDNETACVLWDPLSPQPLPTSRSKSRRRRLSRPFLVTPLIQPKSPENEEIETTVNVSELKNLLEFESLVEESLDDSSSDIPLWKDRGDQLLKLGDASKACAYYEMALRVSSILQIGATAIVKVGGHAKVADIDCLEDDDDAIEVTMQETEEEKILKESDVLLCILYNDQDDHLQERILLNLSRCLLQLADLAKHQDQASERRPKYLRSAVLATTLALTIAEHEQENNSLSKYGCTALVLRGQAQAGLGKFPNAISDTKKVLQADPTHKEALKQLRHLQGQQQKQKNVDKKLVKSMCKWVQKATNEDPVSSNDPKKSSVQEHHENNDDGTGSAGSVTHTNNNLSPKIEASRSVSVPIIVIQWDYSLDSHGGNAFQEELSLVFS